jgi:hypothetical protein
VRELATSTTTQCFAFFGRFLDSVDPAKEEIGSLKVILASWQKMRDEGQL